MSQMMTVQARKPAQSAPESAGGVLQRKCDTCRKKKPLLQRSAINSAPETVPPIVHDVLRSHRSRLDPVTHAFMEPHFVHDFSKIPVRLAGVQAKLTIGSPGDLYEQEADRIANQVIAMPTHTAVSSTPPRIQCLSGQLNGLKAAAPESVDRVLASPGRSLDPTLQEDMGQRFGHDFSRVRVHSGSAAEQSARELNANAYTVGHNIVFGGDQLAQGTYEGRRLIAHELTHVVQQTGSNERRVGQNKEQLYRPNSSQLTHIAQRRRIPTLIQRQLYPPIPIIIRPSSAVEINAVDARQVTSTPWYAPWRYTGPLTNFFRGDVTMTNTASMVTNVIAFLRGRKMHRLNVMDHGNEDGVEIGDDWMQTPMDVATHAGDLGRLTSSFGSGAFVHMQNCHSGKNQPLICALARAFGAPVYAGTGLHNPLLGFNFGDYVRCEPSGAFTPDAGRPQTPTPPPADMTA